VGRFVSLDSKRFERCSELDGFELRLFSDWFPKKKEVRCRAEVYPISKPQVFPVITSSFLFWLQRDVP